MMEIKDVVVGMRVSAGVAKPRNALVYAEPVMRDGRWHVPVEYLTGYQEELPLSVLHVVPPKRPSARYGRDEPRGTLHSIVASYNELLPEDQRVTEEQLEVEIKLAGVGR